MEKSKRGIIIETIVLGLLFVFNIVFGSYNNNQLMYDKRVVFVKYFFKTIKTANI